MRDSTSGGLAKNGSEGSLASVRARDRGRGHGGGSARRWRGPRVVLIAVAVLVFLAITAVAGRFFAAENVERDHELVLLQAQAAGDVPRMLAELRGCGARPSCVATVRANATRLRRAGTVQILSTQATTNHSLTGSVGETRVAWKVSGHFPVVQCVRVRRAGNFLTGISIALLDLSAPIASTADC